VGGAPCLHSSKPPQAGKVSETILLLSRGVELH